MAKRCYQSSAVEGKYRSSGTKIFKIWNSLPTNIDFTIALVLLSSP